MTEAELKIKRKECEVFSNYCIVFGSAFRLFIEDMIQRTKDCQSFIPLEERRHWDSILKGLKGLNCMAMDMSTKDYKDYKQKVLIVLFMIKELMAKCDDNPLRMWQFYNSLHVFPTVVPELLPTIEEQKRAFPSILG